MKIGLTIALLALVAAVVFAAGLVGPAVPDEIRLLTGPEGTTFHEDGLLYQELLARHGVTVHLEETSGSVENLSVLADSDMPTAAFIWGMWDPSDEDNPLPDNVQSLGTMFLQPLWVFAKRETDLKQLKDLSGKQIEAGEEGSDSRLLAVFMLQAEGVGQEVGFTQDEAMTAEQAVDAIKNDRVGAIIATGEPDSELIDTLLRAPEMKPVSIRRADAFAIKHDFLRPVRFPEGAQDLNENIPDQDLQLLAARAQLVVSNLFPAALADLLLLASAEIYERATPFSPRGTFPSLETAPLELNRSAEKFYKEGPPKLQKFLPFRLATLIDRFFAAAVAFASAAVAISKIVPALISLPFKLRVRRSYKELDAIERSAAAGAESKDTLQKLQEVDEFTAAIGVPMSSLETAWLELRQYVHDMRDRLVAR